MEDKGVSSAEIENAKLMLGESAKQNVPENIAKLIEMIQSFGVSATVEFDPSIARGLDYYTGTVFEIYLSDKPEYGSICSGGRYDNLVDTFSKESLPAVGGSIGIDRLLQALDEMGETETTTPIQALVLNLSENLQNKYISLANNLRTAGINVELYYSTAKLDKQFKYAESKSIPYAIIMGEEESSNDEVQLKDLVKREQETVKVSDLAEKLK